VIAVSVHEPNRHIKIIGLCVVDHQSAETIPMRFYYRITVAINKLHEQVS
jgi:hypothetical protein